MKNETVSVIIPAYNEEKVIGGIVREVKKLSGDYEIIVVDDGSADNTAKVAEGWGAKVIRHPDNIGNGAAVKSGIRDARGQILVTMDGDGQHDPADIKRLLKLVPEYDMVVGARTRDSGTRIHRRLANKLYNLFATYVTRFPIEDLTSGFRAVRRKDIMRFLYLLPNTFSYPTTLTLAFLRAGRSVKYIPIETHPRVEGRSKIQLLADGVRFLLIITRIATFFSPFKIFLPASIIFFILGLGNYAYTFITEHRFTNMSALLFTTSLLIFMLGLISEQIAQLRLDRSEDEDK